MTASSASSPAAPDARRRGGPPVWFAVIGALGILVGLVIVALEVLGIGVSAGVPGVSATTPPTGSAAQLTHDRVQLALQDAAFQVQDPATAFRPGESPTMIGAPRRLLQAVLPSDPQGGYVVIYEFPDANAADAAGREFMAYLGSGTGGIGYPQDERYVLRRMDRTLIYFPWSPTVSPDPEVARLASVLEGLGSPLTGQ